LVGLAKAKATVGYCKDREQGEARGEGSDGSPGGGRCLYSD